VPLYLGVYLYLNSCATDDWVKKKHKLIKNHRRGIKFNAKALSKFGMFSALSGISPVSVLAALNN
jgi:hypothetical protein